MNTRGDRLSIRAAKAGDALEMSVLLSEILTLWGSERDSDPAYVRKFYIDHPDQVSCAVAVDQAGDILGVQSLKRAVAGNPYGAPVGWGVIGTYVKHGIGRRGVGTALFDATAQSAGLHGVRKIDATISDSNKAAISYYEAMGFLTYRQTQNAVCKCYSVAAKFADGRIA